MMHMLSYLPSYLLMIRGIYENIKRLGNNAKRKWKIIAKKPDSILIETSASLLNGKYAVILKKKVIPPQIIYYLIIQNDSTYLCSSKVLNASFDGEWE